jgi:DNA ligase-1
MKDKTFKPLLAPNEQIDLKELNYPLLASTKLDGIRCIFYKGQILSRSLKQIQNKQLRERFEELRKYTETSDCILDGEIYSSELTFQEITHFVMTQDLEDEQLPNSLKFYCFDRIGKLGQEEPFCLRLDSMEVIVSLFQDIAFPVEHIKVNSAVEVESYFEKVLTEGYEGLILRNPESYYKYGRATVRENIIYKCKPFRTFDAKITGIVQSTEVNEDAEKKTNELGRSVTSKKIGERHTIEKASAFWVEYNNKPLKVTLAMSDLEKIEVWKNRESYIGKWIEYKGMLVGAKDVPRHPVMIRYRTDKD